MTEFELIARYFTRATPVSPTTRLGIGDDCALLAPRPGHALAVSTDMLVAGRHFFADVDPAALGWKTLAVNLSDLAAMGARPLAFTLALAMPGADDRWLSGFSNGLFECADAYACPLVGGDTTRGPLTLSVTVFGEVPEQQALRRDGARIGDDVWVSGTLGGAAWAVHELERHVGPDDASRRSLERPVPRVALGRALLGLASAAIDVSDGFAQDLGHVLARSGVGALVDVRLIPCADILRAMGDDEHALRIALSGGDDYELCFTAPAMRRADVLGAAQVERTPVTRVGRIVQGSGVALVETNGAPWSHAAPRGFDHFA